MKSKHIFSFPPYILWINAFRYYFRSFTQSILAVLGVAVGIAVFVAVDLANDSAKQSFRNSAVSIFGDTEFQLMGSTSGISENVYSDVVKSAELQPLLNIIRPIIDKQITLTDSNGVEDKYRLLGINVINENVLSGNNKYGIDFLNSSQTSFNFFAENQVFVSSILASKKQLSIADEFLVEDTNNKISIVGFFQGDNSLQRELMQNVIITDISVAQNITNSNGILTRIDISSVYDQNEKIALDKWFSLLPSGVQLIPSYTYSEARKSITKSFDTNLLALSLLALLVGLYLIYNMMTFSIHRRKNLFGTLRAIGVTKNEIFFLVLVEGLLIGLIGAIFGIMLGILLAYFLLGLISSTINYQFFSSSPNSIALDITIIYQALILGISGSIVSVLIPAWSASRIQPRELIDIYGKYSTYNNYHMVLFFLGLLLCSIGYLITLAPITNLIIGFIAMFLVIVGLSLTVPTTTQIVLLIISSILEKIGRPTIVTLSVETIKNSLNTIAICIAALSVSIAMTIGIGCMIQSFRATVEEWLNQSLVADIYIAPPTLSFGQDLKGIDDEFIKYVSDIPEIEYISQLGSFEIFKDGYLLNLIVVDSAEKIFDEVIQLKEGEKKDIWNDFVQTDSILISEPLAFQKNIQINDTFDILTDTGLKSFTVRGIYYDYSSTSGIAMVSKQVYDNYWNNSKVTSLALYLNDSQNSEVVFNKLLDKFDTDWDLQIISSKKLNNASMEIFDKTFEITFVLRSISLIVAFIGILGAISAIILSRAREFSILKSIGFTNNQLRTIIGNQTFIIGVISGLISIPLGIIITNLLIQIINKQSFGWSIPMQLLPSVFVEGIMVAILSSVLASIYPSIKISRNNIRKALMGE
ncbi:MAG: FtsX-like permease family protein [Dehalococcoidia bacterium]|nr:FtsX-like permease family protein [Dehalococcoidia bacterium]